MNEEMLKNLILCAVAVMFVALVVVLVLLLVRTLRKSRNAQPQQTPEVPQPVAQSAPDGEARPFAVEQEITFIHSQDRLDPEDR